MLIRFAFSPRQDYDELMGSGNNSHQNQSNFSSSHPEPFFSNHNNSNSNNSSSNRDLYSHHPSLPESSNEPSMAYDMDNNSNLNNEMSALAAAASDQLYELERSEAVRRGEYELRRRQIAAGTLAAGSKGGFAGSCPS